MKEQQLKKLEEKNYGENKDSDDEDGLKTDEAKVDESKQMDFARVEKRVRTTGGGSTGTVRYVCPARSLSFYVYQWKSGTRIAQIKQTP